jgi:hypothetical protein
MSRSPVKSGDRIPPRLLTEGAAAAYLSIPVASLRRLTEGRVQIDGRVRWDRFALDAWLDGGQGKAAPFPANENPTDADQALARFLEAQGHAAGRS